MLVENWLWIEPSTDPSVETDKAVYVVGESIVVSFYNASRSATDWLGLDEEGAGHMEQLDWMYIDGMKTGTAGIIDGHVTFFRSARCGQLRGPAVLKRLIQPRSFCPLQRRLTTPDDNRPHISSIKMTRTSRLEEI